MDPIRVGNFTSSEIYNLMSVGSRPMTTEELAEHKKANPKSQKKNIDDGFGKDALTYIKEKRMERRLGRSLSCDSKARALTWGKTVEGFAFGRLDDAKPFTYVLTSQETITHPTIEYWCGSPDGYGIDSVLDLKCPVTLKSFCLFADCVGINQVREEHPDGEKYYWQLVSNAILSGKQFAELIFYVPYHVDLQPIKLIAMDEPGANWIHYAEDEELPYLIMGGSYPELVSIRFEVPQSDKDLLTSKVLEAGKLLLA